MFYDIYLYTLYYYICCLLWRMYEMHPDLSLKAGCDKFFLSCIIVGGLHLSKILKTHLTIGC
jgi:hypothetical protein